MTEVPDPNEGQPPELPAWTYEGLPDSVWRELREQAAQAARAARPGEVGVPSVSGEEALRAARERVAAANGEGEAGSTARPEVRRSVERPESLGSFSVASERHRERNEDTVLSRRQGGQVLAGVFDGMSNPPGGEVASAEAMRGINDELGELDQPSEERLAHAFRVANQSVIDRMRGTGESERAGTTAAVFWVGERGEHNERQAVVASAGDSRVYVLRANGTLEMLTLDDSVASAALPEDEAWALQKRLANVATQAELDALPPRDVRAFFSQTLTNALGEDEELQVRTASIRLEDGDTIFATSDGIHDNLTHEEIRQIAIEARDADDLARRLVQAARARSGDRRHVRRKPDDMSAVAYMMGGSLRPEGEEGAQAERGPAEDVVPDWRRVWGLLSWHEPDPNTVEGREIIAAYDRMGDAEQQSELFDSMLRQLYKDVLYDRGHGIPRESPNERRFQVNMAGYLTTELPTAQEARGWLSQRWDEGFDRSEQEYLARGLENVPPLFRDAERQGRVDEGNRRLAAQLRLYLDDDVRLGTMELVLNTLYGREAAERTTRAAGSGGAGEQEASAAAPAARAAAPVAPEQPGTGRGEQGQQGRQHHGRQHHGRQQPGRHEQEERARQRREAKAEAEALGAARTEFQAIMAETTGYKARPLKWRQAELIKLADKLRAQGVLAEEHTAAGDLMPARALAEGGADSWRALLGELNVAIKDASDKVGPEPEQPRVPYRPEQGEILLDQSRRRLETIMNQGDPRVRARELRELRHDVHKWVQVKNLDRQGRVHPYELEPRVTPAAYTPEMRLFIYDLQLALHEAETQAEAPHRAARPELPMVREGQEFSRRLQEIMGQFDSTAADFNPANFQIREDRLNEMDEYVNRLREQYAQGRPDTETAPFFDRFRQELEQARRQHAQEAEEYEEREEQLDARLAGPMAALEAIDPNMAPDDQEARLNLALEAVANDGLLRAGSGPEAQLGYEPLGGVPSRRFLERAMAVRKQIDAARQKVEADNQAAVERQAAQDAQDAANAALLPVPEAELDDLANQPADERMKRLPAFAAELDAIDTTRSQDEVLRAVEAVLERMARAGLVESDGTGSGGVLWGYSVEGDTRPLAALEKAREIVMATVTSPTQPADPLQPAQPPARPGQPAQPTQPVPTTQPTAAPLTQPPTQPTPPTSPAAPTTQPTQPPQPAAPDQGGGQQADGGGSSPFDQVLERVQQRDPSFVLGPDRPFTRDQFRTLARRAQTEEQLNAVTDEAHRLGAFEERLNSEGNMELVARNSVEEELFAIYWARMAEIQRDAQRAARRAQRGGRRPGGRGRRSQGGGSSAGGGSTTGGPTQP